MRIILAALLSVFALGSGSGIGKSGAPQIRIASVAPLTISGTGFERGERIKVSARMLGAHRVLVVVAGRGGAFRARFSILFAVEPCRGTLVVTATRENGDRASATRPCRPADPQTP